MIYDYRDGLESFTRDPIGYLDGGNLFEFIDSHPLVGVDPTGLFFQLPNSFEGSDDPPLTPIKFPRWWEDGPKNLTECFDKCIEDNPEAVRNNGESDRAFKRRKDARDDSLENCNFQCMKKHPPTGCEPFKDPKKGEPKKDKDGCWVDDSGRKWCPDRPGDEEPHWDIQPPIGKPGDVWETPCCRCHTKKGKNGAVYTRCFPKNAGK